MEIRSSQNRFKQTAAMGASGLAAGLLAESAAQVTEELLHQAGDRIRLTSLQAPPSIPILNSLLSGSGPALVTGAVSGVGMAAGAMLGEDPIDLSQASWWKRVAFSGPAQLYNSGIQLRQDMGSAVQQDDPTKRFSAGARVGFRGGSRIGSAAGRVQGAFTGGYFGYQMSGQALALVESFLEAAPLPRTLQHMIPVAVTAACIVTGQGVGAMVGQTVGQLTGGALGGLAGGLYALTVAASGLSRKDFGPRPPQRRP